MPAHPRPALPAPVPEDALEVARRLPPALAAALRRRIEDAEREGVPGQIVVQLRLDDRGHIAARGHVVQPRYDHC